MPICGAALADVTARYQAPSKATKVTSADVALHSSLLGVASLSGVSVPCQTCPATSCKSSGSAQLL